MTDHHAPDQRVLEVIEAYGADPQVWPDEDRAQVEAAIAQAPDLYEAALNEARLLDEVLSLETVPEPPISLFEDVLRAAPRGASTQSTSRVWWLRALFPDGVRWPAGAAFASLAMGVGGGFSYAATGPEPYTETEQVYLEAFGYDTYDTWLAEETLQ